MPGVPETRISSSARRRLRARAHALKAIVIVGASGLSQSVVAAIDQALLDHGLIKVRINADHRTARRAMTEQLCTDTGAELIQSVGHVAVLFRQPEDESLQQSFLQILD